MDSGPPQWTEIDAGEPEWPAAAEPPLGATAAAVRAGGTVGSGELDRASDPRDVRHLTS